MRSKSSKAKTVATITTAEAVEIFSTTRKTIALWASRGIFVRIAPGVYDLRRSIAGYVRHARAQVEARGGSASAAVSVERAAMLRLQRQKLEHEFAAQRGEYILRSEADRDLDQSHRYIAACFMQIPRRLAGFDRAMVVQIEGELHAILTEIGAGKGAPDEFSTVEGEYPTERP